jgi:predicted XRE-type DNA-binding protein
LGVRGIKDIDKTSDLFMMVFIFIGKKYLFLGLTSVLYLLLIFYLIGVIFMDAAEYQKLMKELGRKGGYAKAAKTRDKYAHKSNVVINLFLYCDFITQEEIAELAQVSQSFVSGRTTNLIRKKYQIPQNEKITRDKLDWFLKKIQCDELSKKIPIKKTKLNKI